MRDSQGILFCIGDKLKSSVSEECIPVLELINIKDGIGIFQDLFNPYSKPFKMTQEALTNSNWIVAE